MGSFADVKRTRLAMALLLTPVFGVTGCGSDENTQLKTEITQLETEITQLETEITQFEARVDALEEQAGSRVTNLTLDQTDDAVQFQSRSKNAAPGIDASGAPSKADCDGALDLRDLLDRHAVQEKRELPDESQLHYRPDDLDLLDRRALRDVLWAVQSYKAVASKSGDAAADAWAKRMLREPGT